MILFIIVDSLKKQCSCPEEISAKATEKKATENKALIGKWMDQQLPSSLLVYKTEDFNTCRVITVESFLSVGVNVRQNVTSSVVSTSTVNVSSQYIKTYHRIDLH